MKKILIIKCGDTYPEIEAELGNFDQWIIGRTNIPESMFTVYDLPKGENLRHPGDFVAAIITGSHSMVRDKSPWIKKLKSWIIEARYCSTPVLGICFGARIITEALGGNIEENTNGLQAGVVSVKMTPKGWIDPFFKGVGNSFETFSFHRWSISTLPVGAEILAFSDSVPIQAFRLDKIYGTQFHPEFNADIMKKYFGFSDIVISSKNKVKPKTEYKNQALIPNFLDLVLKM